ncbi:MAG: hypothetical protein K0S30_373 [Clostridia bacterium]|jgi:hypothetical protein|nr:hypothetical protein [Clostridia bacterium]
MPQIKPTYTFFAYKKLVLLSMIVILFVISFISLYSLKNYKNPPLVGKWTSLETGEEISFTTSGLVKFKNTSKTGTYTLISTSKMEYTIDNKTFVMYYYLEGRSLSWGVDNDSLEKFIKPSFLNL